MIKLIRKLSIALARALRWVFRLPEPSQIQYTLREGERIVPTIGSIITILKTAYKVRKLTDKDMIIRPEHGKPGYQVTPPLGSTLVVAGFKYRIRKITEKDLVLRAIAFA